jgi:hypothetical protein
MDSLEDFWNKILSRSPELIRIAFNQLDAASKREVIAHLNRMVSEDGWHAEQVASAKAALKALGNFDFNSRPNI